MKNKKYLLFLSLFLVCNLLPLCAKIKKSAGKEIPIQVKQFIDKTAQKDVSELDDSLFKTVKNPINPGFYDGNLWIEIKPEISEIQHCVVSLGNEYIDSAEFYEKRGGKFFYIGKIGHKISTDEIEVPDSLQAFPVFRNSGYDDDARFRIKIKNHNGNFIYIKLVNELDFFNSRRTYFAKLYIVLGISFCIFSLLFIYAIAVRRPMPFFLSMAALFYILLHLQLKGIGSVFLWNFLNTFSFSTRLVYYFETFSLMFLILSADTVLKGNSKFVYKKVSPVEIQLIVVIFVVLLTVKSDQTMLYSYAALSVTTKVFFIVSIFMCFRAMQKNARIILLLWIPYILFSMLTQLIRILRFKDNNVFFDFICSDEFLISFLFYLMITMPSLFFITYKIRHESRNSKVELEKIKAQNSNLLKQKNVIERLLKNILVDSAQTLSMADILSAQVFTPKNTSYIERIKINSAKISDTIAALRMCNDETEIENQPILLADFFKSCIQASKIFCSSKPNAISCSMDIQPETVILADMRVVELFFISFLNSVIEVSVPNTEVSVSLKGDEENFVFSVSNTMDSQTIEEALSRIETENERRNFTFLMRIAKFYCGDLSVSKNDSKFKFSVVFDFKRVENSKDSSVIINKTRFSPSKKKEQKNSEKKKKVTLIKTGEEKSEDFMKKLSSREKQIAELMISGKSDKDIAEELFISPGTVASHNKKIFKKLEVHSRVELMNKLR